MIHTVSPTGMAIAFRVTLVVGAVLSWLSGKAYAADGRPPNILFILTHTGPPETSHSRP